MKKLAAICLLALFCCSCVTPIEKRERSGDIYLKRNPFNFDRIEGRSCRTNKKVFEIRKNPFNLDRYEIREK